MSWPTFVILGAPRAGTTALYAALRQHPQIYMSAVKEPNFFAYGEMTTLPFQGPATALMAGRIVNTRAAYEALWGASHSALAIGEASMTNFMPRACERIRHYAPDAKLIAILRQPAERAYSQFINARRAGWEPLADFEAALAAEPLRLAQGWIPYLCYKYRGYYAARLAPYFAAFPREQIRIYRYEAWRTTPQTVLQDLFAFLGVDATFMPVVNPRLNAGQLPRPWLQTLVRQFRRCKPWLARWTPQAWQSAMGQRLARRTLASPPPLSGALHRQLMDAYRTDIERLQVLLDQDFSDWLA
ncbi:MAG: sulfotransferase [Caldilineaceae bacterium]